MSKYMGPYDVMQDAVDGPLYRPGDTYKGTKERIEQLRSSAHFVFDDDAPEDQSPVHAEVTTRLEVQPPNEQGVTEFPVDVTSKK